MGIWQFLFRLFIKVLVKPFMQALQIELDWVHQSFNLEEELRKQLENISQEQLKILLNDKLAKKVFELESEISAVRAQLEGVKKFLKDLRDMDVALSGHITKTQQEARIIKKMVTVMRGEEIKPLKEVQTAEVDFGG